MQAYLCVCVFFPVFPFLFDQFFSFFSNYQDQNRAFRWCRNPTAEFCTISKRRSRLGDRVA